MKPLDNAEKPIVKIEMTTDGYKIDLGFYVMCYNQNGEYVGQWQDDIYTGNPIFIPVNDGINVNPLTPEELASAC